MAKKKLCLLGEVCPAPLLMVKKELDQLAPKDVLLVETDFSRAVRNIVTWCDDYGHEFTIDEIDNGVWLISIVKQ